MCQSTLVSAQITPPTHAPAARMQVRVIHGFPPTSAQTAVSVILGHFSSRSGLPVRGCTLAIIFTAVTEQVLPALMGEQDEEYEAFVAELSGGKPASAGPSAPPPLDETCLHVGALPADFTEVALSAMFSTYGKIVHHKVGLADRHNPRSCEPLARPQCGRYRSVRGANPKLCCAALYCVFCAVTVLYCTVLYCTVLCCAVLCCAVVWCADCARPNDGQVTRVWGS